jgi:hypothetical protein
MPPCYCFYVQYIKATVAAVVALVWLGAASCCLIDASGLFGKRDCCSKEHSHCTPGPGKCDQPCGMLASASYLPPQDQLVIFAPVNVALFDVVFPVVQLQRPVTAECDLPGVAPPELAGHWQFSFRAAWPPRAPSFAS